MSADLTLYRAIAYVERAVGLSYAVPYALQQAADVYQVPAGEIAELLFCKHVECARAKAERDAMQAADRAIEAGTAKSLVPQLHRVQTDKRTRAR